RDAEPVGEEAQGVGAEPAAPGLDVGDEALGEALAAEVRLGHPARQSERAHALAERLGGERLGPGHGRGHDDCSAIRTPGVLRNVGRGHPWKCTGLSPPAPYSTRTTAMDIGGSSSAVAPAGPEATGAGAR